MNELGYMEGGVIEWRLHREGEKGGRHKACRPEVQRYNLITDLFEFTGTDVARAEDQAFAGFGPEVNPPTVALQSENLSQS